MARALLARGHQPDLVVGTSIGSLNGAVLASGPIEQSVPHLNAMWDSMKTAAIINESVFSRVRNLVNHWTHLHSNEPLRQLVAEWVSFTRIDDAHTEFQCVAACIETSSEHWFDSGSVDDAVLASCALPGVLPPVAIDGLHYIDGGIVNSIPVSRARELGASEIYVLHVGHIDDPLAAPRHPWDVAMVAFEVARRHRFHRDVEVVGDDVDIHVMPTGNPPGRYNDIRKLRYNDHRYIAARVEAAEIAGIEYLDRVSRRDG